MTTTSVIDSSRTDTRLSITQSIAITCWVVLATSTDLKQLIPYIHWYATIALVLLTGLTLLHARWDAIRLALAAGSLLVLSICVVAAASANPVYELLEAGKLGIILLILLPLLTTGMPAVRAALRGAKISVCANVAMALAGALGHSSLGSLMAPGRFGTILNTPGSLWRVGVLLFAGSTRRICSERDGMGDLPFFLASLVLLFLDGSRTSFVILCGASIVILVSIARSAVREALRGRPFTVISRTLLVGLTVVALPAWRALFFETGEIGFFERGANVLEALNTNDSENIRAIDSSRLDMNRDVIEAILDHPILGTGMATTRTSTAVGPVVVHNAYLQIWADVGILGFLAFTALSLANVPALWFRYRARSILEQERRILFYNGMFLLACWAVAGLLHAVSTEVSEWIMFILGYSSVVVAGSGARPRWCLVLQPSSVNRSLV
jgi:O-antigen ligase